MKCHVCAAAAVLMLAGPAYTRWVQAEEAKAVSVAATEESAEQDGVAAVLNRIFRSPSAQSESDEEQELKALAAVERDLAERERQLARMERELAENPRDEAEIEREAANAEREIEEVLRQLERVESQTGREQEKAHRRALQEAERARTRAERQLEEALATLERAEDHRELAAEEAVIAEEFIEIEQLEAERKALERALVLREAELRNRDWRAEYETAINALSRAQQGTWDTDVEALNSQLEKARRAFETQRAESLDLRAALELAQQGLAQAQPHIERLPEARREHANAMSELRHGQDSQAEIVERLKSVDLWLEKLDARQGVAGSSDACNHCKECRALHSESGAHPEHTAPEPTPRRGVGRNGRPTQSRAPRAPRAPREPRAPRPPSEPREPRAPLPPREPRAPQALRLPPAAQPNPLPQTAPRLRYFRNAPPRVTAPDVAVPKDAGCCCCNTCPNCGATKAPKNDASPKTSGIYGYYAPQVAPGAPLATDFKEITEYKFLPTDVVFDAFTALPNNDFQFGMAGVPTAPEGADEPCDSVDDPNAQIPGMVVYGETWAAPNFTTITESFAGQVENSFVFKTCEDGECDEKACIRCNAAQWQGAKFHTDGLSYGVPGQVSKGSFVFSSGDDEDGEDDDDEDEDEDEVHDVWYTGASSVRDFAFTPRGGAGAASQGNGEILAEILELMEEMSIHLEELRGDVRGLREEVGGYRRGPDGLPTGRGR